jgi:hypothetical protein
LLRYFIVKTLKVLVCAAAFILITSLVLQAQLPVGPDLVPPAAYIPEPPAGAKAPTPQTTAEAAPLKPAPHNPGESQVYGVVTDQSGAVLPGARVTISGASGNQGNTTNARGAYFINLSPGTYTLTISNPGFQDFKTEGLTLTADQELEMDSTLTPAAATPEKVDVVGNTVGQVETEKAEVSGTITEKEVVNTPLNGRNFTQLLTFAPGVSNQSGQDEALVGVKGSVKFSVNGGRVEYNTFSVDGADVLHAGIHGSESTLVVYPSLDAINELKVLTSNYGAQYGRSASGTILVDTKSGGSSFHGSAYYFGRNEIFNSRNFFDQTTRAPLYRKHDFGFTLGGPLTIPKLYTRKDRTYYFFSEEVRLEKDPTDNNFNQAVPSLAERPSLRTNLDGTKYIGADFSDVCPIIPPGAAVTSFNPAKYPDCPSFGLPGASTFPYNIVGYHDNAHPGYPIIDPVGAAIADSGMVPLPNSTAGCNSTIGSCYDYAFAQPTYWREELFRIDHDIQPGKLRATFRYIHDSWDTTEARPIWGYVRNSFPTVQGRLFGPGESAVARLTHTISPTLLNEVVVSYTESHISLNTRTQPGVCLDRTLTAPSCAGVQSMLQAVNALPLVQGYLVNSTFGGKLSGMSLAPGNLAYGGGFQVDPGYAPWQLQNPTWSVRDDLSKVIGKHNVQFGVQVIFGQRNEINATNGPNTGDLQGILGFSNFGTYTTSGNEYANSVLGYISSFQQDSAQLKYHNSYNIVEPYVQDDWKVNSRLTLNLGIRFSIFDNYHEKNNLAYNWDPSQYDPSVYFNPKNGKQWVTIGTDGRLLFRNKGIPVGSSQFDQYALNGLVQCGVNGVSSTCMTPHRFNPAPRIGFAWDPMGDGRTSIRGGYGIFFEHGTGSEANTGSLVGSAPLNITMTQLQPLPGQNSLDTYPCIGGIGTDCRTGPGAYPINLTSIPRKTVWPYVQQWSFGVQREVQKNLVLGLSYVGSKGTHLTAVVQPNAFPLGPQQQSNGVLLSGNPYSPGEPMIVSANPNFPGNTNCTNQGNLKNPKFLVNGVTIDKNQPAWINLLAACEYFQFGVQSILPINAYRPFFGIQQIFSLQNVADSNYNAFQATIRRSRGPLTVDISYSYSHSIDDSSDRNDTTIVDPLNVSGNKASSNFDQRHLLNISYNYVFPSPKFDSGRLRAWANEEPAPEAPAAPGFFDRLMTNLIGGWELSGVTTVQSGTPFTVINAGYSALGISVPDNAGVASGITSVASFPDIVGDVHVKGPIGANNPKSFGPVLGNVAAFAAPTGLSFGDAGRNALNNPARWNFDVTLLKHFKVTEGVHLEFRTEIFNIFNHTQFRVYDPSPNFGNGPNNTITCYGVEAYNAAGDAQTDCLTGNAFLHPVNAHRPRTMQFGMKLNF